MQRDCIIRRDELLAFDAPGLVVEYNILTLQVCALHKVPGADVVWKLPALDAGSWPTAVSERDEAQRRLSTT